MNIDRNIFPLLSLPDIELKDNQAKKDPRYCYEYHDLIHFQKPVPQSRSPKVIQRKVKRERLFKV